MKHLPYTIDPAQHRSQFYENYWKKIALDLALAHGAQAGWSWLDYGCGRGEMMELASAAGFRAEGTDIDPICLELSRKFGPVRTLNPDQPLAQFGPGSFDVVSCLHVLEHVDNPKHVLGQLARITRQFVLVAVPNLRYLHKLRTRRVDLSTVNEGHLQSWDHWHLLNLAVRHCGLTHVAWGFDATILPFLSNGAERLFGQRTAIYLETGPFRRLFPFHGISVIGLFSTQPNLTSAP